MDKGRTNEIGKLTAIGNVQGLRDQDAGVPETGGRKADKRFQLQNFIKKINCLHTTSVAVGDIVLFGSMEDASIGQACKE